MQLAVDVYGLPRLEKQANEMLVTESISEFR